MATAKKNTKRKVGNGNASLWKLVGMVVGVFLTLAALQWIPPVREAMQTAVEWGEGVMSDRPVLGAIVFFLFSMASPMMAFVSSALLVPAASEAWGKPLTFVLLWGGWVCGVSLAYWIARLALPLIKRVVGAKLDDYRDLVSRRVSFLHAFVVCVAVPSELPAYLFGAVRYPYLKFVLAAGTAEGLYALGMVIAGDRLLAGDAKVYMPIAGLMLAMIVGGALYVRHRKAA